MKQTPFFLPLLFAATLVGFISGCSGKQEDSKAETHEGHATETHSSPTAGELQASEPQFQVDEKFREQLTSVFKAYVELKEALVESDAEKVQKEASDTKEALTKVDMKLVSGAAHNDWMNYLAPMEKSLAEIQSSNNIESQRQAFSGLSENLYKSIKAFGLNGQEAFYEYCPMAFDNQGAYWLSDQSTIRNPYFGDKMLTCGEVKEKLM